MARTLRSGPEGSRPCSKLAEVIDAQTTNYHGYQDITVDIIINCPTIPQYDQIWQNLTKYRDFSKNLVQKSHFFTIYDLFGQYDVKKKKNAPARNAPAGRDTSEFGKKKTNQLPYRI